MGDAHRPRTDTVSRLGAKRCNSKSYRKDKRRRLPGEARLIEYTTQLVPGWWLGTNIANRDKMRTTEKALRSRTLEAGIGYLDRDAECQVTASNKSRLV